MEVSGRARDASVSRARVSWQSEPGRSGGSLRGFTVELPHVNGVDWFWPSQENAARCTVPDRVRLLTPFDPVVWDRARFEMFWGWQYRFEAYVPAPKRRLGYYALPLLWRDRVIGWGNVFVKEGQLNSEFGYVAHQPRDRVFKRELDAELERMKTFLAIG